MHPDNMMLPVHPAPASPKTHGINLKPIEITHHTEYERRTSTQSITAIPSPSLVAARAYHLHRIPPINHECNALRRRKSLFEVQQIPRRHSTLVSTGEHAIRVATLKVPQEQVTRTMQTALAAATEMTVEVKEEKDEAHSELDHSIPSVLKIGSPVPKREQIELPNPYQPVPFKFAHDNLREWGHAYLGNSLTADAFINPVSLRRSSLIPIVEDSTSMNLVRIRARIHPRSKERKPFVIQKDFDINQLRSCIPLTETTRKTTLILRRSSRDRRPSIQQEHSQKSRRGSTDTRNGISSPSIQGSLFPIREFSRSSIASQLITVSDIEYALHYLPVLAALMLSDYVKRGDTIDLPVPHPESWKDTLTYIYTGRGAVSSCMQSNLVYFAGNV